MGQDAVGQFAEGLGDIANLLLTLLRILIHRKHTQDDILVLNVTGLYQLLETVPILCRIIGIDIGIHLQFLQFLIHILLCHLLALSSQFVIEIYATVGRGEGRNLDIVKGQFLMVIVDLRQQLHEFLHRVVLQFALAEGSLLNEELDIGLLFLLIDALVAIESEGRSCRNQCLLIEF